MLQAVPRSLATTCGISVDFFSSGYLDVSVRRVRSTHPIYSGGSSLAGGFPHSDICGSKLVCQLPAAFRRLPRPSSPVIAKASTTCTYSLDSIILRPLSKLYGKLMSCGPTKNRSTFATCNTSTLGFTTSRGQQMNDVLALQRINFTSS